MKFVLVGFGFVMLVMLASELLDQEETVIAKGEDQRVSITQKKTTFTRAENEGKRKPTTDRIREMVTQVLQDIITGKASLDERGKLEDRAIAAMEIEELGTEDGRITTAVWLIDAISKQIELAGLLSASISTDLNPTQVAATKELARQFAGDVKDRLANGAEGHEGAFMAAVDFTVPDGHVKVK